VTAAASAITANQNVVPNEVAEEEFSQVAKKRFIVDMQVCVCFLDFGLSLPLSFSVALCLCVSVCLCLCVSIFMCLCVSVSLCLCL